MSIGIPEIILIVVVVLLLFGAKRIPELARSLGKAQHEYKKAKDASRCCKSVDAWVADLSLVRNGPVGCKGDAKWIKSFFALQDMPLR